LRPNRASRKKIAGDDLRVCYTREKRRAASADHTIVFQDSAHRDVFAASVETPARTQACSATMSPRTGTR